MTLSETRNIILIGLSGSGKSSLGKRLSARLRRPLLDTDAMVEARAGKTISRIFAEDGEEAFRNLETLCVREAAAAQKAIIVTGGGVVLREENMKALAATGGFFFFIDRHPARILRSSRLNDRPLVHGDGEKLFQLYKARLPLYRRYSNCLIRNAASLKQAMLAVIANYKKLGRLS